MTIIDRARDALKQATPGPWEASKVARPENDWGDSAWRFEVICFYVSDGESPSAELVIEDADAALIVAAPELAAEVVRLHDEFAALADAVDQEAEAKSATGNFLMGEYHGSFAARIREVIERGKA